jgi:hypothetical protein
MQGTVSQKAFRGDCFSNIWIAKIQAAILAINRITALLLPSNKKSFQNKTSESLDFSGGEGGFEPTAPLTGHLISNPRLIFTLKR